MALRLKNRGVVKVRPLAGGFERWRELGYPLTPHEEISSADRPEENCERCLGSERGEEGEAVATVEPHERGSESDEDETATPTGEPAPSDEGTHEDEPAAPTGEPAPSDEGTHEDETAAPSGELTSDPKPNHP